MGDHVPVLATSRGEPVCTCGQRIDAHTRSCEHGHLQGSQQWWECCGRHA